MHFVMPSNDDGNCTWKNEYTATDANHDGNPEYVHARMLGTCLIDANKNGIIEPAEVASLLFYPTSADAKWVEGGAFTPSFEAAYARVVAASKQEPSGATPEDSGLASGLSNTAFQIGAALGVAIAMLSAPVLADTMSALPGHSMTVTNWYKQNVYDTADSKIGEVKDVLVSQDGAASFAF